MPDAISFFFPPLSFFSTLLVFVLFLLPHKNRYHACCKVKTFLKITRKNPNNDAPQIQTGSKLSLYSIPLLSATPKGWKGNLSRIDGMFHSAAWLTPDNGVEGILRLAGHQTQRYALERWGLARMWNYQRVNNHPLKVTHPMSDRTLGMLTEHHWRF